MDSLPLVKELKPISLNLDQLYLDPNNPRFVGPTWEYVSDDRIDHSDVQESVRKRLIEGYDIDRLRDTIEINGYLPIDQVVVREFKRGKYVVLEGNRRICAAKLIGEYSTSGEKVSASVLESLRQIPCQQYLGSVKDASWVFQGLRHISGIRDWPAYNKARLLVEQMEDNGLKLTEVARRFGISSYNAGQWRRAYKAFEQARTESEKAASVGEEAFPYFQELFNRSCVPLREWMAWRESESLFDPIRLSEFVDWLYPDPSSSEEQSNSLLSSKDRFEERRIRQAIDLRRLSEVLTTSPEGFESFRRKEDLDSVHAEVMYREHLESQEKKQDFAKELLEATDRCSRLLDNVPLKLVNDVAFANKFRTAAVKLQKSIDFVLSAIRRDEQ